MANQSTIELVCQSCGMPMKHDTDFGTTAEGKQSADYCTYCFQQGVFTQPDITLEKMIDGSTAILIKYGVPEEAARAQVEKQIPQLTRWKK